MANTALESPKSEKCALPLAIAVFAMMQPLAD
jgi:hypothetical protein